MPTNESPLQWGKYPQKGVEFGDFNRISYKGLGITGLNLETPLFMAVFLPEHYVDPISQFFTIMNLIHVSDIGNLPLFANKFLQNFEETYV